eukprot:scaffold108180_cov66-Phaeocystis_antarctica.AAC.8
MAKMIDVPFGTAPFADVPRLLARLAKLGGTSGMSDGLRKLRRPLGRRVVGTNLRATPVGRPNLVAIVSQENVHAEDLIRQRCGDNGQEEQEPCFLGSHRSQASRIGCLM